MEIHRKIFFLFLVLFYNEGFAQNDSDIFNYSNSLRYGEYLIRSKQFLLAVPEFERIYFMNAWNDSIKKDLLESYRRSQNIEAGIKRAEEMFPESSDMSSPIASEYLRMLIYAKQFEKAKSVSEKNTHLSPEEKFFVSLNAELFSMKWKSANNFFDAQPGEIKNSFLQYVQILDRSNSIKKKSPFIAGGLSAIVPGTGKLYTGKWQDAIISFITIGSCAYQSYRGFSKKGVNSAYGWIFGTLAFGFHSGNIFGSYKAARNYNSNQNLLILNEVEAIFGSDN